MRLSAFDDGDFVVSQIVELVDHGVDGGVGTFGTMVSHRLAQTLDFSASLFDLCGEQNAYPLNEVSRHNPHSAPLETISRIMA